MELFLRLLGCFISFYKVAFWGFVNVSEGGHDLLMGPHMEAVYSEIITVMRAAWQLHWQSLKLSCTTDLLLCGWRWSRVSWIAVPSPPNVQKSE